MRALHSKHCDSRRRSCGQRFSEFCRRQFLEVPGIIQEQHCCQWGRHLSGIGHQPREYLINAATSRVTCVLIQIQHSYFENNRAVAVNDIPILARWTEERNGIWQEQAHENWDYKECGSGRGGAIFAGAGKSPEPKPVDVFLSNLYFSQNSASVGGMTIAFPNKKNLTHVYKVVVTSRPLGQRKDRRSIAGVKPEGPLTLPAATFSMIDCSWRRTLLPWLEAEYSCLGPRIRACSAAGTDHKQLTSMAEISNASRLSPTKFR